MKILPFSRPFHVVGLSSSAAIACVLVMTTGCITGTNGVPVSEQVIQPGATTATEVYEKLGTPTDLLVAGEYKFLIYDQDVQRGSAVMFRYLAVPILHLEHVHTGTDALVVTVRESDNVVENVGRFDADQLAERRLWPFGE